MEKFINTIPNEIKIKKTLNLPKAMGEFFALSFIEEKLRKNKIFHPSRVFNPDPPYFSYIPAAVDYVSLAPELLTSYTPYQAEVSQGLLQILFEYQSMICELTGMDVCNASLYDHATALNEACRMALKYTDRKKILIPKYMRKERKEVLISFFSKLNVKIEEYNLENETGNTNIQDIESKIKDSACAYIEYPNYFGIIDENLPEISKIVHENNALLIVGIEPISLGLIREPASYNADIVVGEAQHLAINPFFGGPSLGIIACKEDLKLIHLMPGRIVGCTTTQDGSRLGFSLVLQAREQHIKREKATSNITTNQSWLAVRAAIYLSLLGKTGLKRLAGKLLYNTNLLKNLLQELGFDIIFSKGINFRNILVRKKGVERIHKEMLNREYYFGRLIGKDFNELGESLLLGVNEYQDVNTFDALKKDLKEVLKNV